jgi:cyclohexyl-isocyanide hydratase
MAQPVQIGILLYPNVTQLDATGPAQVLSRVPGAKMHMIWKTRDPVPTDAGFSIVPTTSFAECPPLDVICVPGGAGQTALMGDPETLDFLRKQAAGARYVTSVCTGALVLGAAGLLRGKRAATHWMSRDLLREFGAEPVAERVVVDGRLITGGGVTAGIDIALRAAAEIAGRDVAEAIQLMIEYDPHPPFDAGSPSRARPDLVERVRQRVAPRQGDRIERVRRAAAALGADG